MTPEERAELEEDLISFCDHELEQLGDIRGLEVLYAGGSSLLWIEGLSRRIGENGSLTALNIDEENVRHTRERLAEAGLDAPVYLVEGDVFDPPFENGAFDLVYSAGLFHELDVREEPAEKALAAFSRIVRTGGRVATSDFVDSAPAAQIEEEELQATWMREALGTEFYGIGPPERLAALHERVLADVEWRVSPPHELRHYEKIVLAEEEPAGAGLLPQELQHELRGKRSALRERIRQEGYMRPATLYVEGRVAGD